MKTRRDRTKEAIYDIVDDDVKASDVMDIIDRLVEAIHAEAYQAGIDSGTKVFLKNEVKK